MHETIFNDERRAAIARGWKASGLTQEEYSAKHGIKPRTLRQWLKRWPCAQFAVERQAKAIIEKAIAALTALLGSLDADQAHLLAPPSRQEAQHRAVVEEPQAPSVSGDIHADSASKGSFWTT
jgi:transposase-like protein